MQLLYGTFGFVRRLHLHESEAFRALCLFVSDYLDRHHLTHSIKQIGQIALSRIKREIAHIEPGAGDLNGLWFTRNTRDAGCDFRVGCSSIMFKAG